MSWTLNNKPLVAFCSQLQAMASWLSARSGWHVAIVAFRRRTPWRPADSLDAPSPIESTNRPSAPQRATVKRSDARHDRLAALSDFGAADGFGRRRKTLRGLMPDAVVDAAR
jgi:hypothetical protein